MSVRYTLVLLLAMACQESGELKVVDPSTNPDGALVDTDFPPEEIPDPDGVPGIGNPGDPGTPDDEDPGVPGTDDPITDPDEDPTTPTDGDPTDPNNGDPTDPGDGDPNDGGDPTVDPGDDDPADPGDDDDPTVDPGDDPTVDPGDDDDPTVDPGDDDPADPGDDDDPTVDPGDDPTVDPGDDDDPTVDPNDPPQVCALALDVELDQETVQPTDTECTSRMTEMEIVYTADGCAGTTNFQDGRVTCSESGTRPDTVRIEVEGGSTPCVFEDVQVGDTLVCSATDMGESDFDSNTIVTVIDPATGDVLETTNIHTSCSAPIHAGDNYGSFHLTRFIDEDAEHTAISESELVWTLTNIGDIPTGEVELIEDNLGLLAVWPDVGPGETVSATTMVLSTETTTFHAVALPTAPHLQDCSTEAEVTQTFLPPPAICNRHLHNFTLRYTGESCSTLDNDQGGIATCTGDAALAEPITLRLSGDRLDEEFDGMMVGDEVYIDPSDHPRGVATIEVVDANDNVLATIAVDLSCDEPLDYGDVFGPVVLTHYESHAL